MDVPAHIAIIMDGNGRWAQGKGLPRLDGHRQGAKTIGEVIKTAGDMGVKNLSFYAFSTENWKRSAEEVDGLMFLLRQYCKNEVSKLHKKGVRIIFAGDRSPSSQLPKDILKLMDDVEAKTAQNDKLTVCLCINYGGRNEIVRACQKIVEQGVAPSEVTEDLFAQNLDTQIMPDPEVLIRTSGEQRLSNFLPWQLAYSEFFFVDEFWPDFTQEHLHNIVKSFKMRERRFGKA